MANLRGHVGHSWFIQNTNGSLRKDTIYATYTQSEKSVCVYVCVCKERKQMWQNVNNWSVWVSQPSCNV